MPDERERRRSAVREASLLAVVALLGVAPGAAPSAERPSYRVERGDVRVTVPLKPGGAFQAKTSSLTGSLTPGASKPLPLDGEITVDLASIDTGINLRNQHLREKYLEIGKGPSFDRAVLSEIRLNDADGEAFTGRTAFSGTLLLHGTKHAVAGTAEIRREGALVHVDAKFPLTLPDFAIEPPEYLGVGVASRVLVEVSFTAASAGAKP